MKKKDKQASELLTRIYRSEGKSAADVENELSEIQEAVRTTSSITFQQESYSGVALEALVLECVTNQYCVRTQAMQKLRMDVWEQTPLPQTHRNRA